MTEPIKPDVEVGSAFDPSLHAEQRRGERSLGVANAKKVFGSGKGRLAIIVVALVFVALVMIAISKMFSKGKGPAAGPQVTADSAVLGAPGQVGGDTTIVGSEEEARMRAQTNRENAKAAQNAGEAYLAPPVLKDDHPAPQTSGVDDMAAAKPRQPDRDDRDRLSAASGAPNPADDRVLREELQQIREWREKLAKDQVQPQVFRAMGLDAEGKPLPVFVTSTYAVPDRTKTTTTASATGSAAPSASASAPAAAVCSRPDIEAGSSVYGTLSFGLNSDDGSKFAIGVVESGPYAGAKLIGQPQYTEKNVSATFDKLSIPGRNAVTVKVVALDDVTGYGGIADDVDTHAFARYSQLFVSAIATGLGKAASMQTGTTTTTNNVVTTTDSTPMTAQREAKIAIGEVGTVFGEDLKRRSDQLKPTITTKPRKGVGLVFLEDVCLSSSVKR